MMHPYLQLQKRKITEDVNGWLLKAENKRKQKQQGKVTNKEKPVNH